MKAEWLKACILILACAQALLVRADSDFRPEKVSYAIQVKEDVIAYRVMAVFVLPGEALSIRTMENNPGRILVLKTTGPETKKSSNGGWIWQAPSDPGLYPLEVMDPEKKESITLNIFVMVPYDQLHGEMLNGYRIGSYPRIPLRQLPIYKPPAGFIEVTHENEETPVSPHFKLKQFVCKQKGGYPKYLVLRERLLLKLEMILEKTNASGYKASSFHIMSGYRTPYYNKKIGNVRYSRHIYGGAADIYIDENPRDGMMDDLNRDGKCDYHDADIIYDLIDEMYGKPWYEIFQGGLGRYKKTASHGPFVHVDARGFRARWGT